MKNLKIHMMTMAFIVGLFANIPVSRAGDTLTIECEESGNTRICKVCFNGNCRYELNKIK